MRIDRKLVDRLNKTMELDLELAKRLAIAIELKEGYIDAITKTNEGNGWYKITFDYKEKTDEK